MSTLAEELLQDFEDSGPENGSEQNDVDLGGEMSPGRARDGSSGEPMLDGDEEEQPDEDEEMKGVGDASSEPMADEESAKAQIEKMDLGRVKDVREVTSVMERLDTLLKVSQTFTIIPFCKHYDESVYISWLEQ